jgi:hypothetical protein
LPRWEDLDSIRPLASKIENYEKSVKTFLETLQPEQVDKTAPLGSPTRKRTKIMGKTKGAGESAPTPSQGDCEAKAYRMENDCWRSVDWLDHEETWM